MLVPNQLKNTTFPLAGRGAYRAQDVDEFQKRVYVAYSELYSENSVLKKKFASLSALVEEYNEGKNSIANAIIKSQALSDKMLEDAKKQAADLVAQAEQEANQILADAQKKADDYAREKITTADAYLSRAETELDRVKKQAEASASDYIQKVNEKAGQIMANANEQASKIVASAYADAKKASEKCDEIIKEARAELDTVKRELALFKAQTKKMIAVVVPALDNIEIPEDIEIDSASAAQEPESQNALPQEEALDPFAFRPDEPHEENSWDTQDYDSEEVVDVTDEDTTPMEFEDISSDSGNMDDYFSSLIEDMKSSAAAISQQAQTNADNSDETDTQETSDGSDDQKGYNGNNTTFKSSSGFIVTDFDDDDEDGEED